MELISAKEHEIEELEAKYKKLSAYYEGLTPAGEDFGSMLVDKMLEQADIT